MPLPTLSRTRGWRPGWRPGRDSGRAGGTGRKGLLEELLADGVIVRALREAPTGRPQCGSTCQPAGEHRPGSALR